MIQHAPPALTYLLQWLEDDNLKHGLWRQAQQLQGKHNLKPSTLIWSASLFFLIEELEDMFMSAWGKKKKMKNKHSAYLGQHSFKAFKDKNLEEGEVMLQNKP